MSLRDSHAFHIANLIDQEPEAQVVTLFVAEQLEAQVAELKAENERLNDFVSLFASCPCCCEFKVCKDDCEFKEGGYEHMELARAALSKANG